MPIKRNYKRKPRTSRKSKARRSSKVSFAKKVKTIVHRMAENKRVSYNSGTTGVALNTLTGSGWNTTSVIAISPYASRLQIDQGNGQASRNGNIIAVRKLVFRAVFYPAPYDAVFNATPKPLDVTLYFVYSKANPNSLPTSSAMSSFFQAGSSTAGMSGRLTDGIYTVNSDLWTLKKKVSFKLGYASYGGSGTSAADQSFSNNEYKLNKFISLDLTKHCLKIQKYNDNDSVPNNAVLFCLVCVTNADGTATSGSASVLARMHYTLDCEFEDM